jgi:hypothetical protein
MGCVCFTVHGAGWGVLPRVRDDGGGGGRVHVLLMTWGHAMERFVRAWGPPGSHAHGERAHVWCLGFNSSHYSHERVTSYRQPSIVAVDAGIWHQYSWPRP